MLAAAFHTVIFQYSYEALLLILIISGPPIVIASIIGLFVAIFQAATQIQEQTFAFAIKLLAVFITIMVAGGWLGSLMYQFAVKIFTHVPQWR